MQSEAVDYMENWAARPGRARAYARKPGPRLTLDERRMLLSLIDLLLVNGMLVAALVIWQDFSVSAHTLTGNLKWFVTLSAVWFIVGRTFDLYNPVRAASATTIAVNSSLAGLFTALFYLAIPWLTPAPERRFFAFGFIGLSVVSLTVWRALYALAITQPNFEQRVLIVGQGPTAQRLARELNAAAHADRANPFRGTGYHIVGFVENLPVDDEPALDPAHSLIRLIRQKGIDELLVAEEATLSPAIHEALLDCRELDIPVNLLAETYARLTNRLPVEYATLNLRLVTGKETDLNTRLYHTLKRALDLLSAAVGLVALAALIPLVALGNALTSPGPVFYRQHRVGRAGRPFAVLKFRTMKLDAEANGAVWACEADDRVTPPGRWMRRAHIDEIPQVINVLRGEMSLVGPRPERPQFVGEISRALPIYRARHAVLPGITGWAQIHYPYGDSVEDARIKLEYDLYYVQRANLGLDLLIMLRTLPTMLFLKGQ